MVGIELGVEDVSSGEGGGEGGGLSRVSEGGELMYEEDELALQERLEGMYVFILTTATTIAPMPTLPRNFHRLAKSRNTDHRHQSTPPGTNRLRRTRSSGSVSSRRRG